MIEWLGIPVMIVVSLVFQALMVASFFIVAVFVGRWFLTFGVKVGLASSIGDFGAAITMAYRERLQDP